MNAALELSPAETGRPGRWVLLAGIWIVNLSFGLVMFSLAPLVAEVSRDLGLGLTAMGTVLGAWPLVYMLVALPLGAYVDRIGLRRCVLIGIILVSLSALLRASADTYLGMYLAVSLLGLGVPLISIATPKLINYWFAPGERGAATGLYMSGPSVGAMLCLGLTQWWVMPLVDHQWRRVLVVYGVFCVLVAVAWWLISRTIGARGPVDREAGRIADWGLYLRLLARPVARKVLILATGVFLFMHGLNNWVPEMLRLAGMDPAHAGLLAALPIAITIIGAVAVPRFTPAGHRARALAGLFTCGAVAAVLLSTSTLGTVLTGLVLLGIARSALWPLTLLCLTESGQVDATELAPAGALFFTFGEIGGMAGPVLMGAMAQATGGFRWPMATLALICVGLALLSLSLERLQRVSR